MHPTVSLLCYNGSYQCDVVKLQDAVVRQLAVAGRTCDASQSRPAEAARAEQGEGCAVVCSGPLGVAQGQGE